VWLVVCMWLVVCVASGLVDPSYKVFYEIIFLPSASHAASLGAELRVSQDELQSAPTSKHPPRFAVVGASRSHPNRL